jgi:hypothetical protein
MSPRVLMQPRSEAAPRGWNLLSLPASPRIDLAAGQETAPKRSAGGFVSGSVSLIVGRPRTTRGLTISNRCAETPTSRRNTMTL